MKKYSISFGWPAVLLCAAGFVFVSCGGKTPAPDAETAFADPQVLAADSIAIDQVIAPAGMTVVDGKMVISSSGTDTVFYVYSLPDFRFLYSGVRTGGGPEDFSNAQSFRSSVSSNGRFLAADVYYMGVVRLYSLEREGIRWSDTLLHRKNVRVRAVLGTGRALVGKADGMRDVLAVAGGDSLSVLYDSLAVLSRRFAIPGPGTLILNTPKVAVKDGSVTVVYPNIPRAEFYRLDSGGKFERQAAWGDTLFAVKNMELGGNDWFRALAEIPYYYIGAMASGDHFYAVYQGQTEGEYGKNPYNVVRVFTLDGKPVKAFRINGTYGQLAVDEVHRRIYAVDSEKDFDYVYVFRYEL